MNSCAYIAAVCIQNCFCDVLTMVPFVNYITNVLQDMVPYCKQVTYG